MKKHANSNLIAIAGGIGSGKSVVCRCLEAMGYRVYDCDSRARRLMDANTDIQARIAAEIAPECVTPLGLDRKRIAEIVFADAESLGRLNAIVHSSVRADLERWYRAAGSEEPPYFVETAILYQSGLDKMVDAVWQVEAPMDIRLRRVMARSGLSANEVMSRIDAQDGFAPAEKHPRVASIVNDGDTPLLPQIITLLNDIK